MSFKLFFKERIGLFIEQLFLLVLQWHGHWRHYGRAAQDPIQVCQVHTD